MSSKLAQPKDANGEVIIRAMGMPKASSLNVLCRTVFSDIFDFSAASVSERAFIGLSAYNPDDDKNLILQFSDGEIADADVNIVVAPGDTAVFDNLLFGPSVIDPETEKKSLYLRAALSGADGTAAFGTIDYDNGGMPLQPADGQSLEVGGKFYEFSDDLSSSDPSDASIVRVDIGASADLSWTALVAAINANSRKATAAINTGTNLVTLTARMGGVLGNAITLADVDTTAVFSGATFSGAANGVTPIINIW